MNKLSNESFKSNSVQSVSFQTNVTTERIENLPIEVQKDSNAPEGKLRACVAQELRKSHVAEPKPKPGVVSEATHTVNQPQVKNLKAYRQSEQIGSQSNLQNRVKRQPPPKPERPVNKFNPYLSSKTIQTAVNNPRTSQWIQAATPTNRPRTTTLADSKPTDNKTANLTESKPTNAKAAPPSISKFTDAKTLLKEMRTDAKKGSKTIIKKYLQPFLQQVNKEIYLETNRFININEQVKTLQNRNNDFSNGLNNKEREELREQIGELIRNRSTLEEKIAARTELKKNIVKQGASAFKNMLKSDNTSNVKAAVDVIDSTFQATIISLNTFQSAASRIIHNTYKQDPEKKDSMQNVVQNYHNKAIALMNESVERQPYVILWGMANSSAKNSENIYTPNSIQMANGVTSPQKGITGNLLPDCCEDIHKQCVLTKLKELNLNLITPRDELSKDDIAANLEQFKRVFDPQTAANLNDQFTQAHDAYKRRGAAPNTYITAADKFMASFIQSQPQRIIR